MGIEKRGVPSSSLNMEIIYHIITKIFSCRKIKSKISYLLSKNKKTNYKFYFNFII